MESIHGEETLFGVRDGKAVGTCLEPKFQVGLLTKYAYPKGNSAKGIDFPRLDVDIKVTSIHQPQSSCPFKNASYYLSFQQENEGRLLLDILNSPPCQEFLACLVFPEAKRPITVELLQRLSIQAIAEKASQLHKWNASGRRRRSTLSPILQSFLHFQMHSTLT